MKFLLTAFSFLLVFSVQAQSTDLEKFKKGAEEVSGVVNEVGGVVGEVGGLVSDVKSIFGGGSSGGFSSGSTENASGMFNPDDIFPAWGDGGRVRGVIGSNGGALNQGESRLIIYFIPKIIELMIWLVAPIVTVMFIYAGLQFVYGGDREEEVKKARDLFRYAVIGLIFVVLSYSLMKAVFFVLV